MKNKIRLICPSCNKLKISVLVKIRNKLVCTNINCEIEYPIVNNIPVILSTAKNDFHSFLINKRGLDGKLR